MEVASQTEQIPQTEPLRLTSFGTSLQQGEALGLRKRKAPLVRELAREGFLKPQRTWLPFRGELSAAG